MLLTEIKQRLSPTLARFGGNTGAGDFVGIKGPRLGHIGWMAGKEPGAFVVQVQTKMRVLLPQ